MKYARIILTSIVCLAAAPTVQAQGDVIRLQFSDPAKPGFLKAHLTTGKIEVTGHDSNDIIIEMSGDEDRVTVNQPKKDGLRRISGATTALSIEEVDNRVDVQVSPFAKEIRLKIKVPRQTSLDLHSVNAARIEVTGVYGDHELNVVNGGIHATALRGSVVAHALNDDLVIDFDAVTADKTMAFSSLNGDVDVTFPAGTQATFKVNTQRGDVYTGFDLALAPVIKKREGKTDSGKGYRVEFEQTMAGDLNGGGAEISMRTMNGDILIRKGD